MTDDGWEKVGQPAAAGDDGWESIPATERPAVPVGEALPEAFMGRVSTGQALDRVLQAAAKGASEGAGPGTPTGFEDDVLAHLIEKGVFHDPATGRGGPLQMANEAVMIPAAKLWETINRGFAGGIHGAGGALERLVTEFGGSSGDAARAGREVINLGNWAMIESGMGRFSRPTVESLARDAVNYEGGSAVMDRPVGNLPTPEDFSIAGRVMKSPHAEANLRRMWSEDGIHPAEAVHDAQTDAFVKNEITAPREVIKAIPEDWRTTELSTLPKEVADYIDDPNVQATPSGRLIRVDPETGDRYRFTSGGIFKPSGLADVKMGSDKPLNTVAEVKQHLGLPEEAQSGIPKDWATPEEMEAAFGPRASLSAAVTEPGDIPLDVQPPRPPGSLLASATAAADKLFDVGRDIQMKLAPMARGSVESMATVKDYMNAMRRNAWDSSRIDTDIVKRFTAEQRERMSRAMEEESLSLRLGEPESARQHQGLATLDPAERQAVLDLDAAQQLAWLKARDAGIVEGDGIPMHFPRMAIGAKGDSEIGKPPSLTQMYGIRKNSPYLKQRQYMEAEETEAALKAKYGDQAKIAWDIRAVNLATKMLEDAVAGRTLINNIEEVGKRTGDETVAVGFKPADGWFTVDHPAFQKWRPKLGDDGVIKDEAGNPVFEQVPIYVRGDFEGPLRSALWGRSGATYQGLMALKGKTMGLIMNSPMIHNLVEFGRAMPAMPVRMMTLKTYFDGYRAKTNPGVMHEAIDAGLVPIGKRFFNQDINAIMEAPDLTPGRSLTAKALALVPGWFDEAAGTAVKQAIDKAGDFWHNTLLWDRIGDLQAGLYVNFRDDMVAKGMDRGTATKIAAHFANRYAGALPKEAMSEGATKLANFMMFSRSFTLGNLGVMKDMLTGLPKDVLAQIERDAGFKAGSIEAAGEEGGVQQAVTSAKAMARRKAWSVVGLDIALMYAGNSILQSAFNVMLGDNSLGQEGHEYIRRWRDLLDDAAVHPLSLLNPAGIAERMSATGDNEPGRKDRVLIGYAKDGTGIYMRNPVGKIGEEFSGYFGSPLDMMRKKEGTLLRPMMQLLSNDAGFGRKVYDPTADTPAKYAGNIWQIVKHFVGSQLPVGQINAFSDLVKGEGDSKVNALQAFGPFAGVTFSKGAPGGPAVGEMYDAASRHKFEVDQAMPDIRKQIKRGDQDGAVSRMTELDIPQGLQKWYIKTTLNPALRMSPRAVRDFNLYATPEQKARFERARQGAPQ